ncbi:hypothetical protein D6D10_08579 [Aureobasidium pullulans]|uniref:Uncharacterized protein n=1 Tax=Aureobasidium pullulans TaxID=5580 RepID=A0A4S9E9P1_AURPU|nr:hypothetical protein D6D10_08579 [Aureobasidium pullulans]
MLHCIYYYLWVIKNLCIRLIEDKLYFHLSKGTLYLRLVETLQICLVEEIIDDCLIEELTSDRLVEEVSSNRLVKAVLSYRLTEDNLETRLFKDFYSRLFPGPDATSSSQIQAPFEVTHTGYHDPGQDHTLYPEYFFTKVSDPVTNTTTGCLFYHVYVPHNRWPSIWTYCQDPTFAIKMAYYSWDRPSWGLEFRHQYQEDGQKCDVESSDDCTTVHAFVSVDSNTPGFTSSGGGFSNTDYYKGPAYAGVTFRCTGDCGVVSTEKIEPYHING